LVAVPLPSTSGLYSRDLASGATTELGSMGGGSSTTLVAPMVGADSVVFQSGTPANRPLYYRALGGTTNELVGTFQLPRLQAVSDDGRWIAFSRPTGPAGAAVRPYSLEVHDQINATNQVLTSVRDPVPIYDELARQRRFSGDGRLLVFSDTSSLVVPDDTNGAGDVFLADLDGGAVRLVSVDRTGTRGGNGNSDQGSLSLDGRWVVFRSTATDLTDDPPGVGPQIFLRDLVAGKTVLVSRAIQGGGGNGGASRPLLLPDNHTVVFSSTADDLVAGDFNGARDLFVARVSGMGTVEPFRVEARLELDGAVKLAWPYAKGSSYQVQSKPNLDAGWTGLASAVTVDGTTASARVPVDGSTQGFLRVVVVP
jgi:Tol biopolymer transport system component